MPPFRRIRAILRAIVRIVLVLWAPRRCFRQYSLTAMPFIQSFLRHSFRPTSCGRIFLCSGLPDGDHLERLIGIQHCRQVPVAPGTRIFPSGAKGRACMLRINAHQGLAMRAPRQTRVLTRKAHFQNSAASLRLVTAKAASNSYPRKDALQFDSSTAFKQRRQRAPKSILGIEEFRPRSVAKSTRAQPALKRPWNRPFIPGYMIPS
jgi:hypothetical protein